MNVLKHFQSIIEARLAFVRDSPFVEIIAKCSSAEVLVGRRKISNHERTLHLLEKGKLFPFLAPASATPLLYFT